MSTAVIAFSGGLDTSLLVPYVRDKYAIERVVTCSVDTGGFDPDEVLRIKKRAEELGADKHIHVDAAQQFYDEIIKYLIYGNVSRDGYPLCVGSERLIQARAALEVAKQEDASYLVHGSTGAGNDQYRFDLVAHVLGQTSKASGNKPIEILAPVREYGIKRRESQAYLRERGISVPESTDYSYNVGLWGVSIGGKETLVSDGLIPEKAWYSQKEASLEPVEVILHFEAGEISQLDSGAKTFTKPLEIIQELAKIGGRFGIGRHYHVGTSIPGKKGRLAYESPAADIIYAAHKTLESLTLTQNQIFFKKLIADELGKLIHEAMVFDPLLEDLKAYLVSSQNRVTGQCKMVLSHAGIESVAVRSPYDLLDVDGSQYGEYADGYSGKDAASAATLHAYEQMLYYRKSG